MNDLKPCPNPECRDGEGMLESTSLFGALIYRVRCIVCGMCGPCDKQSNDARILWNRLPRISGKEDGSDAEHSAPNV